MKLCILLSYDAANLAIEHIVKALYNRGHHLRLYAFSPDKHNIRMFFDLHVDIWSFDDLDDAALSWCDAIFCANDTVWRVIEQKKMIFTYNFASVFGTALSEGGDVMFLQNYMRYHGPDENTVSVVSGNARIKNHDTDTKMRHHRFLFIDSGHYPFGTEGKRALAKVLLNICNSFPQEELVIKPRFLRTDEKAEITHVNHINVIDCILESCIEKTLPDNMTLLYEHRDLNELISSADVVLCMYTGAFFDAVGMNKPVIVIRGLPNNNSVDNNNERYWDYNELLLAESGCLVHYLDVTKYLPDGIYCDDTFMRSYVPVFGTKDAFDGIADAMEIIYQKTASGGGFPAPVDTDLQRYDKDIHFDSQANWEDIIERRFENSIRYIYTRYFDQAGLVPDYKKMEHFITYCMTKHRSGLISTWNEAVTATNTKIMTMLLNKEKDIFGDAIKESWYLDAMYRLADKKLSGLEKNRFLCVRAADYFWGLYYYSQNFLNKASICLQRYLTQTEKILYEEYVTDRKSYVQNAKSVMKEIHTRYPFPLGARIVLYGYGAWGRKHLNDIAESEYAKVVVILDRHAETLFNAAYEIVSPEKIGDYQYDYVFITVADESARTEIRKALVHLGVKMEHIL